MKDAGLRRQHGAFVVEGAIAVRRLFASGWPVLSVLLRPERVEAVADVVDTAGRRGVPVYVAGAEVFDRVTGFHLHRGVLALAARPDHPAGADPVSVARAAAAKGGAVVVVEAVNDHENLGALFRNAAVLGAGAVFLDPTCCDPLYRRSVRVSLGHILQVPFARIDPWPEGLGLLSAAGYTVVALSPTGDVTIDELVAQAPTRTAVLVGAEGPGLSAGAIQHSHLTVRIPMAAGGDSLNVATTAAIALHRLADPRV